MAFKARRTVISLDPRDIMQLQEVLMDEDGAAALAFLNDVIGEKLRCAQDDSHRPDFEGGIRTRESHHLSKGAGHGDSGKAG